MFVKATLKSEIPIRPEILNYGTTDHGQGRLCDTPHHKVLSNLWS